MFCEFSWHLSHQVIYHGICNALVLHSAFPCSFCWQSSMFGRPRVPPERYAIIVLDIANISITLCEYKVQRLFAINSGIARQYDWKLLNRSCSYIRLHGHTSNVALQQHTTRINKKRITKDNKCHLQGATGFNSDVKFHFVWRFLVSIMYLRCQVLCSHALKQVLRPPRRF